MKTEHNTLALTNHAAELARLNELTAGLVMNARDNGASWADIGAALGTSKQAAQQKYGAIDSRTAAAKSSTKVASKEPAIESIPVDPAAPASGAGSKMLSPSGQLVEYATNGRTVRRGTEEAVLASYEAHRQRKSVLPELCPGCGVRWHSKGSAFHGICAETQNDHVWSPRWPIMLNPEAFKREPTE